MLKFRKINYSTDLEQILILIHNNLDPEFTVELFKWKHLENPFGESYGLLALDNEKIVGLRMFMFWKFFNYKGSDIINAVRPVDTVVDKNYRGQGLFKRLTLTGLEECKKEYDFVFNTPNENSLPGYLKMGWRKLEKVDHFRIALVNPFYKSLQFQEVRADSVNIKKSSILLKLISTYRSSEYFQWRFKNDKYNIAYFPKEEVYVSYRISGWYIVISEIFGNTNLVSINMLNSLAKKKGKHFLYYYDDNNFANIDFRVTIQRKKPVIVLKNQDELKLSKYLNFSLSDLEAVF